MPTLISGLILFLGVHSLPMASDLDRWLKDRLGVGVVKGVFSFIALVGVVLIALGYGTARASGVPQLYDPPIWLRHVTVLLMVPVFPLFLSAYLPGRISTVIRHPVLAATKIWAFSHLLANGDLASLLLFLSFLIWAIVDRISAKRRPPKTVTSRAPSPTNDVIAVAAGLGIYLWFLLWGHAWLIGVPAIG